MTRKIFFIFLIMIMGIPQNFIFASPFSEFNIAIVGAACMDGIDNDLDGFIDFPDDPGCADPSDNSEDDGENPPVLLDDSKRTGAHRRGGEDTSLYKRSIFELLLQLRDLLLKRNDTLPDTNSWDNTREAGEAIQSITIINDGIMERRQTNFVEDTSQIVIGFDSSHLYPSIENLTCNQSGYFITENEPSIIKKIYKSFISFWK